MSCDFKPGDEVVCVDTSPCVRTGHAPFTEGAIYTIRAVDADYPSGVVGLMFEEVPAMEFWCGQELGWDSRRFRKVQKRNDRLTIEAFSTIKDGFEEPKRAPAKKRERVQ